MPVSAQEIWKSIILGIANAKMSSSVDSSLDCEVVLDDGVLQVKVDSDNEAVLSTFAEAMRLSDPDAVQSILGWDFNSIEPGSAKSITAIGLKYIEAVDSLTPTKLFNLIQGGYYKDGGISMGLILSEDVHVLKVTTETPVNNSSSANRAKIFNLMILDMRDWLLRIKRDGLVALLYPGVNQRSESSSDSKWEHYIQAIFSYDSGKNEMIFDAGLLKSLLVPQPMSITEVSDENGKCLTMDLNLERLYTWLSQSKDWLLVPVLENKESSRLVLWAKLRGHTVVRDRRLFLVLDRSRSMDGYMHDLNSLALNMQKKFLEKAPCAKNDVEVLYFNEGCESTLNENISTPVDCDMNAEGGTSFQVVLSNLSQKLQYYHREKPEGTSYVIMLTDGCDMGDCRDYDTIFGSMNSVEGASYVIGLGRDIDNALCREVAKATGGEYSSVSSLDMEQFSAFDISNTRSVFSVSLSRNGSAAEKFNVSFKDDDLFTMVDRSLVDGDGIIIQGRNLTVCRRRTQSFVDMSTGEVRATEILPLAPASESAVAIMPPQPPSSSSSESTASLGIFSSETESAHADQVEATPGL